MADEHGERERRVARRRRASEQTDVSRAEHENLCGQVIQHAQTLRRIDAEVKRLLELTGLRPLF